MFNNSCVLKSIGIHLTRYLNRSFSCFYCKILLHYNQRSPRNCYKISDKTASIVLPVRNGAVRWMTRSKRRPTSTTTVPGAVAVEISQLYILLTVRDVENWRFYILYQFITMRVLNIVKRTCSTCARSTIVASQQTKKETKEKKNMCGSSSK
jgi:hypothetical protein